jgi:hypothetical protein
MPKVVIKPELNEKIAFHVFTPALVYRMNPANNLDLPVSALRLERDNYEKMYLFDEIECTGKSKLTSLFDNPLPGTNGRGVSILFTTSSVVCSFIGDMPVAIDCSKDRTPEQILQDVIKIYNKPLFQRTDNV